MEAREQRFTEIYNTNEFQSKESKSGVGSEMGQTAIVRSALPVLLDKFKIKSIIDAPCGDVLWFSTLFNYLYEQNITYIGVDIVAELVRSNYRFSNDKIMFLKYDIVKEVLPTADLVLCRDCLVHLSFKSAEDFLNNFIASGSTYLLTTTFPKHELNSNFQDGTNWYPINLTKFPFSLPEPLYIINEGCTEANMEFTDKSLGLWHRDQIIQCGVRHE